MPVPVNRSTFFLLFVLLPEPRGNLLHAGGLRGSQAQQIGMDSDPHRPAQVHQRTAAEVQRIPGNKVAQSIPTQPARHDPSALAHVALHASLRWDREKTSCRSDM